MQNFSGLLLLIFSSFLSTSVQTAGDAGAGQAKAVLCAACHGAEGISSTDIWPNLKGQKYGYLGQF